MLRELNDIARIALFIAAIMVVAGGFIFWRDMVLGLP